MIHSTDVIHPTEQRNHDVTTHTSSDTSLWVRRYHPAPDSPVRLVCFPHAGGSASYFNPVSAALSPAVEVAAIQYPGRQDRRTDPCVGDLGELAALVWEQLRQVLAERPGVPTALFGHSMGSIVAFEVARLMEREPGTGPLVLFASGRRAPSIPHDDNVSSRDEAGIVAEMRALGGTDSRVLSDPELLEMVLPALRNDYRAVENYCSDSRHPDLRAGVRAGRRHRPAHLHGAGAGLERAHQRPHGDPHLPRRPLLPGAQPGGGAGHHPRHPRQARHTGRLLTRVAS